MQIIPLSATPSQTFDTVLGDQNCSIKLYQKSTGLYIDVSVDGTPVATAVICRDRVKLVRYGYRGFVGNLAFFDTQGVDDPQYDGLGSRYKLVYLP